MRNTCRLMKETALQGSHFIWTIHFYDFFVHDNWIKMFCFKKNAFRTFQDKETFHIWPYDLTGEENLTFKPFINFHNIHRPINVHFKMI